MNKTIRYALIGLIHLALIASAILLLIFFPHIFFWMVIAALLLVVAYFIGREISRLFLE